MFKTRFLFSLSPSLTLFSYSLLTFYSCCCRSAYPPHRKRERKKEKRNTHRDPREKLDSLVGPVLFMFWLLFRYVSTRTISARQAIKQREVFPVTLRLRLDPSALPDDDIFIFFQTRILGFIEKFVPALLGFRLCTQMYPMCSKLLKYFSSLTTWHIHTHTLSKNVCQSERARERKIDVCAGRQLDRQLKSAGGGRRVSLMFRPPIFLC